MKLHELKPAPGARRARRRLGRGPGSGLGKTSGRGHKGQKSRTGYSSARGFEGGQMPLHRRLPKRGFTNIFRKDITAVNLRQLARRFEAGSTVTPEELRAKGLVKRLRDGVKILGDGELEHALTVKAHAFSASARAKIEKAGGTCQVIAG